MPGTTPLNPGRPFKPLGIGATLQDLSPSPFPQLPVVHSLNYPWNTTILLNPEGNLRQSGAQKGYVSKCKRRTRNWRRKFTELIVLNKYIFSPQ
jgi:hypothetical protein